MLWVLGKPSVSAVGMGAHVRRKTGDQFDFFSIDNTYDDGVHMHSTIRQLNGCANGRDESIVGTKGTANLDGVIDDLSGKQVWKYEGPTNNSLVQEHVDWVTAIRTNKPANTAKETSISTLMAIGPRLGLHGQGHHVDRPHGLDDEARAVAVRAWPGSSAARRPSCGHRPRTAAQPQKS